MDPLPRAHLLGIPRELRDKIYSYLHHPIHKEIWTRQNGPSPRLYRISRFTIHNAPLPSLLLTHSQLASEYREAACCTDAIISVQVLYIRNEPGNRYRPEPPWASDLLEGRLTNVRHVTIYMDVKHNELFLATRRLQQIMPILQSRSPSLAVFRLAVRNYVQDGIYYFQDMTDCIQTCLDVGSSLITSAADSKTAPPNQLLDLAIRQRGEGYLVANEGCAKQDTLHFSTNGYPSVPETYERMYFSCSRVGLYVYSGSPVLGKHMWRCEDIFDFWPMIPPFWEIFLPTQHKLILDNLNKIIRWREMWGGELEKWQGHGGELDSWLKRMKEMSMEE